LKGHAPESATSAGNSTCENAPDQGGADSLPDHRIEFVTQVWPSLPEPIRAAILTLVEAVTDESKTPA